MKSIAVATEAFTRRDVVLFALSESEAYALETQCVSSQTEDGPIKLCIGARASDSQLKRISECYNIAVCELEQFRAAINSRLA